MENTQSQSFVKRGSRFVRSAGPIQEEVESLLKRSKVLDARLERLENRAAMKLESIQERPRIDPEAVVERWTRDMQILATGTYEEKRKVYQEHEDAGLSPSEVKRKLRESKSDDAWVDEMLAFGGQDPAK